MGCALSPESQLVAGLGLYPAGPDVLGGWVPFTMLSPHGLTLVSPCWRKTSKLTSTLLAEHTILAGSP